jgi:hypothetical protein
MFLQELEITPLPLASQTSVTKLGRCDSGGFKKANFATPVLRRKKVLSGPRCGLNECLGQTPLKTLL